MKKMLGILLGFTSLSAFAEQPSVANVVQQMNSPTLKLAIYDMSNQVAREIEGNKYSLSQKGYKLCWQAFNMPFQQNNKVVEIFKSPKKARFNSPNGSTVSSQDGKTHTVMENVTSINGELIQKCWGFDHSDPLGKYSVNISVNQIEFPTKTFEIVK